MIYKMINRTWLLLSCTVICILAATNFTFIHAQEPVPLFDGRSFRGWEGDTLKTWRIEKGTIVGGSLEEKVPKNDFLCTKRNYSNFVLRLKFKLVGTSGFVNAGVQFRSKRLTDPAHEMIGYQADIGPKYWGSLYDESRRNKTLVLPDSVTMARLVRTEDWNDFEISCDNRHIKIFLNGEKTVDYVESDQSLPQSGLIGLQIHGGGKAEVYYKDLMLTELK
jgi:3-keto-disaccharide hydrolase